MDSWPKQPKRDDQTSLVTRERKRTAFSFPVSVNYTSQNRTKWKYPNNNFKVGEIVIVKEDNIPPTTWPLGKIIETHPGKDGVVRVVTLKTVKGLFKRPINKLCKLPLHQE
ncbi:DUF5641 domain-containing protein [Trichonephila clavata]|uniref:DUF5641 domain-containing protein n=1 Tax=Trichonephila clavata TaxID=2740835 RepID=A0A8X6HKZ6_TRICU|nr:DUF5641 domain-containing protein [Trichonephila clavata]